MPLEDAQRTTGLVRFHAAEWHIAMKTALITAALATALALLLRPWWRARSQARESAAQGAALLRNKILTREFLSSMPPGQSGVPRCVLMDWNVGDGVASLVAFEDGTTSLYFSSGGGIIGAGAHANVQPAAAAFRDQAATAIPRLASATRFPLPSRGGVVFYVVTDSATLSSGELRGGELRGEHPLAALHDRAQALITEIRRAS